jgi:hypothetical protein
MKKQIIAVIYFAATIVYTESRAEDSALQSTAKKYVNKEKPFNNKKVITYKFVADFGESRTKTGKSNEIETKKDESYNSIETSLTYIRSKKDKSEATFIGNQGSGDVTVIDGNDCVSFLEIVGAGYCQQLIVTNIWNKNKGGFVAVYTRTVAFEFGEKYFVSTTTFNGIAIPWD